jgi:hypothetical protein
MVSLALMRIRIADGKRNLKSRLHYFYFNLSFLSGDVLDERRCMQFEDLCLFSKLLKGNGVTLAILVKLSRNCMLPYIFSFVNLQKAAGNFVGDVENS